MRKLYGFIIAIFSKWKYFCNVQYLELTIFPDTTNVNGCFQLGDTLVIDNHTTQQSSFR